MAYLLRLFSKNGLFAFFIFLQMLAVILIFTRNSMQQSFLAAQASTFNAWVSGYIDEGASYLKLKQVNEDLVAQNKILMEKLYGQDSTAIAKHSVVKDTLGGGQVYTMVDAEIVQNTINRSDNYFTINRGENQGVKPKMGVIAPQGIAGIVINTTGKDRKSVV